MSYSKRLLLYEEDVNYGNSLKIVFLILPTAFIVMSIYLWSTGESMGALALLAEAVIIGTVFLLILPRKYQIFEDHLRIVLGGPFSVKIGFDRIVRVEVTSKTALTINLVSRIAKTYVRIVRKNGLGLAITPKSNEEFVNNVQRALSDWARTRRVSPPNNSG
jgi:hypothetical protein